ncbi:MAG TPA: flavodoxin family protein [Syntrophales bacterium]|nr:flavodoxin family protein [Syntrophales bacterium]
MKIVALLGSPHGLKGNTARLLKIVLEGAKKEGARTEIIVVNWKKVGPCLACDVCHIKGRCRQKDDFETIKEKIMAADALIMATPNYIDNVSAQLKAFIDRCCGVVHCMGFEGRYGAAVVTSGGGNEKQIAEAMNYFLIQTGIRPVGEVWATMMNVGEQGFPEDITNQALTLGGNIVAAAKNKIKIKKVERQMQDFRNRMQSLMMYRKDKWPYEYRYWQKKR